MKKILTIVISILLVANLCYGWTWTKSWSSSNDGSAFGGSDIQNIQSDVSSQALEVSGTPAQGAVMYYSGSSWTQLAAGTSGQFFQTKGSGANPVWATGGLVVQVVNTQTGTVATGTTIIPYNDTIPQNIEGDEYMTLAITPTSATNKLKIEVVMFITCSDNSTAFQLIAALFQDSTADALAAGSVVRTQQGVSAPAILTFTHYMTAGTTSSTTFKVRAGPDASATLTFNGAIGARYYGGVMASSITITEISV